MMRNIAVKYDTDTNQLIFKTSNGDVFEAGASADVIQAITDAITAALGEGGAIKAAIDAAIAAIPPG
jgi:hypothetical protein